MNRKANDILSEALKFAMNTRPQVGGFPYLAEVLRQAGVTKNSWQLPSCQSIYVMDAGVVVNQGTPLVTGTVDVPAFDRQALIKALRTDQAGQSTFPEFLNAAWAAGVVSYEVDFENRRVTYYGSLGEIYVEDYPEVNVEPRP
jgi:uncharacterized protein YbcV (DUF1398 family)